MSCVGNILAIKQHTDYKRKKEIVCVCVCTGTGRHTHVFGFEFLVSAPHGCFLQLVYDWPDHLLVLHPELLVNDLNVPHRVHTALHVDDIFILKGSCTFTHTTLYENELGLVMTRL